VRTHRQQGGRHRQQERPGTGDQYPVADGDAFALRQGLRGAGGEDAGQFPAGEGQGAVVGAGGEDERVGFEHVPAPRAAVGSADDVHAGRASLVVPFERPDRAAGPPVAAFQYPGALCLVRVERHPVVLPAGLVGRVEQGHLGPRAYGGGGGGQPRRPGADDDDVTCHGASARDWVVTTSPSRALLRQARTSRTPLTVTRQSKQTPMPQKTPRGAPDGARRHDRSPAARSRPAIVCPSLPVRGSPSRLILIGLIRLLEE
jgi:hypothetical protein